MVQLVACGHFNNFCDVTSGAYDIKQTHVAA